MASWNEREICGFSARGLLMRLRLSGWMILFILVFSSCSGEPPAVLEVYHEILIEEDRFASLRYETLSLFVHVDDPDGIEDIESVYCIADDHEVYVGLDSSSWRKVEREGEIWLGNGSIVMPDRSDFPRADYRILVIDANGERAEGSFSITNERIPKEELVFPHVQIDGSHITVTGGYTRNILSGYGADGSLLGTAVVGEGSMSVEEVFPVAEVRERIRSFCIQAEAEKKGYSLRSGPYNF